jgi:polysaccharide deacetylase 2 family uncharacterized protein YibQ
MHRLPELLVASVAVLVLCGLLLFIWTDVKQQDRPVVYPETSREVVTRGMPRHYIPFNPNADHPPAPVTIAPLKLLPLPFAVQEKRENNKPQNTNVPVINPLPMITQSARTLPSDGVPVIALVIDDCGVVDSGTRAAIDLPAAVTLTFLPYGRNAAVLARQAQERGHPVLLHMPMQPIGRVDPGPNALTVDLSQSEITQRVRDGFAALPPVLGLNNHMGSRFTSEAEMMQPVIQEIKKRNLFFLDSVTSAQSVAANVARAAGVPNLSRDVFLDDIVTEDEVERELARAESIARKHGSVIAIGHPHPSTLKVLNRWLAGLKQRGFRLIALPNLLPRQN